MADSDRIQDILYAAVEEINRELPPEQQLEPSLNTVLFGAEGRLNSIALVTFVLLVEEKLRDSLDLPISLSDERAMSQRNSPFRSLRTLHAYITSFLQEREPTSSGSPDQSPE